MVTLVELLQLVYEELVSVHEAETSVSDSSDHVDIIDRDTEIKTPFFGFEWDISALNRGFGGNRRVVDTQVDAGDFEKTIARDYELMLDLSVVVDDDKPRQRTLYMQAVTSHFSDFIDSPAGLSADVNRVREQQTVPSPAGATGDVSSVSTFQIEYTTNNSDTVPAAQDVSFELDANGIDAYPEQY